MIGDAHSWKPATPYDLQTRDQSDPVTTASPTPCGSDEPCFSPTAMLTKRSSEARALFGFFIFSDGESDESCCVIIGTSQKTKVICSGDSRRLSLQSTVRVAGVPVATKRIAYAATGRAGQVAHRGTKPPLGKAPHKRTQQLESRDRRFRRGMCTYHPLCPPNHGAELGSTH